jgi:hypothetical protein
MVMRSTRTDPGDYILEFCLASNVLLLAQVLAEVAAASLGRMEAKMPPSTLVQCSAL